MAKQEQKNTPKKKILPLSFDFLFFTYNIKFAILTIFRSVQLALLIAFTV